MSYRYRQFSLSVLIAMLVFAVGCASTGEKGSTGARNSNVLTREEMRESSVASLHDAVVRLRPRWLDVRQTLQGSGQSNVVVFLDDALLGSPDVLKQYSPESVIELRYVDGVRAATAFPILGGRDVRGVIVMVTTSGSR